MEIDYNKPIDKKSVDLKAYNAKFDFVKKVMAEELPNPDDYKKIFDDVAMFSYMMFQVDGKPLKLYPYQDLILNDDYRFKIFRAANQIGKEQPYSAKVLTINGFKNMGDLVIGDIVYGSNGKSCKVVNLFEQGIKPVYKITFDDNSYAECGLDHLWKIQLPKNRFKANFNGKYKRHRNSEFGRWDVLSLSAIISLYGNNPIPPNRCIIPVTEPVELNEQVLPLDPYIVGVILGDGTLSNNVKGRGITSGDIEIINEVRRRLPTEFNIDKKSGKYHWRITNNKKHNWLGLFEKTGLKECKSEFKFIPRQYLFSSVRQRIDLLRGLMDTDGTIFKSICEFYSKSKQLAEDVAFLVFSLGGKATIKQKAAKYKKNGIYVDCGICYRVKVKLENINPFFLNRKAKKHYKIRYRKERVIRKIEYVRDEISRCILVDSPDNTYLTNSFIVTHNSLALDIKAARNLLIDHGKSHNEAIVSKSLPQSIFQMRRVKSLLNTSKFIDWKEEKGDADSMSVVSVDIKDDAGKIKYTNLCICAPCTEGLLGYDLHELNLDEFEYWEVDTKWFFNQIAQPRTYTTKGNITIFSNPNGADSFGATLEDQVLPDKSKKWHTYVFNYFDRPGNTQKDYETVVVGLSRQEEESTLLAIRSLSDKYFFSAEEVEHSYDKSLEAQKDWIGENKETFWFLDVGAKHDLSVLVGAFPTPDSEDERLVHANIFKIHAYPQGYPLSRVVGSFDENQATDGWHYEKSVKEYLEEYSLVNNVFPTFGCDVTGNQGMIPLFNTVGIDTIDINFSGPKKWAMYQRLKYYLEKKLLHRIKSEDFEYQMKHMIVTKLLAGRYNRVSHEKDSDHDDIPDSVAGMIYILDNPEDVEPSMKMFGFGEK